MKNNNNVIITKFCTGPVYKVFQYQCSKQFSKNYEQILFQTNMLFSLHFLNGSWHFKQL